MEAFRDWASKVKLFRRPTRKPAPRYAAPTTPVKKAGGGSKRTAGKQAESPSSPSSPANVRTWFAAKGTAKPGLYVYKDVAESYNRDGKGTIKKFSSLAAARNWLQMPAPRMYYEQDVYEAPAASATSEPEEFFAVKGGTCAGVYRSMAKAVQAKQDGGGSFDVFNTEAEAQAFIKQRQMFVVWAGRSTGVMTQKQCILATRGLDGAKMKGPMDEDKARDLWKSLQANTQVLSSPTNTQSKGSSNKKKKKFYYGVAVGKVPGVYEDWKEAERQVKHVRRSLHAKFETKALAQEFVDAHAEKPRGRAPSPTPSTSAASATSDAQNSADDGADESQSQGTAELEIDTPSIEELEKAEEEGKVRVYACHTGIGSARIALSFEKAIEGVTNPEVQVVNSEATLLDNLAAAEVRLKAAGKRKSLTDRLAEARARAGSKSHAKTSAVASAPRSAAASGAYRAGSMLLNRSAVGRAKEVQLIQYYFIDFPKPIIVEHGPSVPFAYELDDDMDLPNTKAIFNTAGQVKDTTITDFFRAKDKAVSSWPLLGFQEFMRVCRRAQRMCQASKKAEAVINAAALGELMDIALNVHRRYDRLGALGQDEERFKARMYLHLQHACMSRKVHASAIAMTVFEDATDPFCTRLPGHTKSASPFRNPPKPQAKYNEPTPSSGCYLCPATDHYCNNEKFHPLVNGKHKPLSDKEKEAILKRIETSSLSQANKNIERQKVKRYWSQHSL